MNPTIFHFNCPLCGAKPGEKPLVDYLDEWRSCPESDFDALLDLYARALREVRRGSVRRTVKFTESLGRILGWCPPAEDAGQLNETDGAGTTFLRDCPVCHTPRGPRAPDRYFSAWREACAVQIANLLYECGIIIFCVVRELPRWAAPERLGQVGDLLALNQAALASLSLLECPFCGRLTTALYGEGTPANPHRCRWCLDRSGGSGFGVRLVVTDDSTLRLEVLGGQLPTRLSGTIVPYRIPLARRARGQKPHAAGETPPS